MSPQKPSPRLVTALLVLLITAAGAAFAAMPDTRIRDEIPDQYKWDFTDIYADWDAWARPHPSRPSWNTSIGWSIASRPSSKPAERRTWGRPVRGP